MIHRIFGYRNSRLILLPLLTFLLQSCNVTASNEDAESASASSRILIIGQDLGAIRGYMDSNCCTKPDALTAYLDFYNLLEPEGFGGLGIDADGAELDFELSWGSGPVSAYKTATEFGIGNLAIGLSMTENQHPGQLQRIGSGDHDDKIRRLAKFFATVDGTVYLRIGYEFDGAWNQGYWNHEQFIAAYRRIVDVLRAEGADNVEYVLQASTAAVDEIIDGGHEDISKWYPGDEYVDWLGMSWFMRPDESSIVKPEHFTPLTPGELADELLALARQKGKPVMIAEASPQAFDIKQRFTANHSPIWDGDPLSDKTPMTDAEIWDYWFAPLFAYMDDNGDAIKALAYINVNWDSQPMWGAPHAGGYWGDSRLETNPELANRFSAAIAAWKKNQ